MTTDQNKKLVQEWTELINARDIDGAMALVNPNLMTHTPQTGLPSGPEGVRMFLTMQLAAFPDLWTTTQDMIAEGDKVVHRKLVEGTHEGTFLGLSPTGKHFTLTFIDVWRIADGKLAEHWVEFDSMSMLHQLGMAPPPFSR